MVFAWLVRGVEGIAYVGMNAISEYSGYTHSLFFGSEDLLLGRCVLDSFMGWVDALL